MFYNNKGSILVTTLIIFSIIITITMTCIALNYSNSSIFILEYKEANIKQIGYGAIEIVHSNILREVKIALETSTSKDEFDKYFLGNKFINSIKDISKSDLKGTSVTKPSEVKIDKINGFLEFDINSLVKDNNYKKKFQASVKIKNPFIDDDTNLIISEYNNINDIVVVYDYKEI